MKAEESSITLTPDKPKTGSVMQKMQIDIWSDIMCPFCYIGKRQLEGALNRFPGKEQVEIIWHSFQLDPELEAQKGKGLYDYVAERKGESREWSIKVHQQVVRMAEKVGLIYNFDKAIVANSFHAHRLIQLAKKHGLGGEAEERLFRAYFTEGEDIGNFTTLLNLGTEIGLNPLEISKMLSTDQFAVNVRADGKEAVAIGIKGVPFFIFNEKYAVSGAQGAENLLEVLEKSYHEWKKNQAFSGTEYINGPVCTPENDCN